MSRFNIAFLIVLSLGISVYGQTYNNPGGTINACSGGFYDSGGALGNYVDNENVTTTFCPDTAGNCVTVNFSSFDIESGWDYLYVYDGPSSASPLIGTYTGTSSPGSVTATNGCLTFVFTSDGSVTYPGWQATIACALCGAPPPCTGTSPACANPAPDICSAACGLGTLSAPPACPLTTTISDVFCLNNTGATPTFPYVSLNGCQPNGSNMPNPSADVWYTFVATSNIIDINLRGLNAPSIGLYEGNNCTNFVGRGCANGSFGSLSATFQPITPGQIYYLQVSGEDSTDQGDFVLTITSYNDCDPCLTNSTFTANPPPTSGVYQPGTTVSFCFTVNSWNYTSSNWIHGVVVDFGPAWDLSTLVTTSPPSCDGNGDWDWYSSVTGTATGQTAGPGFFYDSNSGGSYDGDPGNNYGDFCSGPWTFCWDITVGSCPPNSSGDDLNVSVITYGDGETGSWTSFACAADPISDFFATVTCCPQPIVTTRHVSCFGDANGEVIAEGQGVAPWDYVWTDSNGVVIKTVTAKNAPDTLSGLSGGDYSVEVTDNGQCVTRANFTILEPDSLIATGIVDQVSCNGASDGSITITPSGGTMPYQYDIDGSGFQASNTFSSLDTGTYTITVKDDSGCAVVQDISIMQPDSLLISLDSIHDASCFVVNDGAIFISVSGGTPPYGYNWSNGSVNNYLDNLGGGTYDVTVTDSNSCMTSASFSVGSASSFSLGVNPTDVSCHGGSDGAIDLSVSSGSPPYSYNWSNGAISQDISGLPAGSYGVVVSDSSNCIDSTGAVINEPLPISIIDSVIDARCLGSSDGAIFVSASGGTPAYQYSLDGINFQISSTFNNLDGGSYTIYVLDANSCLDSINNTSVGQGGAITTQMSTAGVSCFGADDGVAVVTVNSANPPFTYSWSNGAITDTAANLIAGTYFVTVADSNSCLAYDTAVITAPPAITITPTISDNLCFGDSLGAVALSISGGTPAYGFQWSEGQVTSSINNLLAGSYSVTITDSNNCTAIDSFMVDEPMPLTLTTSAEDILCNGETNGVVSVSASGGTPNYSYQWDTNAGGQSTSSVTQLLAGTYQVTVTDANNCSAFNSAVVNEPPPLQVTIDTFINPLCNGENSGFASVSAGGGTGTVTFSWNSIPTQSDGTASGLSAGTYQVTATDANGCTALDSVTLTDPPSFSAYIIPGDTTINFGDSLQLTVVYSPPTAQPAYLWEPMGNLLCPGSNCANPIVFPEIPTQYTVSLLDENNCPAQATVMIDVEVNNIIFAPNGFTPDGDGINDVFKVFFGPTVTAVDFKVFNRWGEKLFETTNLSEGWDGTYRGELQPPGVYVYWVEGMYANGQTKRLKGSVTLLR